MRKQSTGPANELSRVLAVALVVVALASIPYIWGYFITHDGLHFIGLTHNIDDGAVYLSWMRQAADGHFFIRNLYTNDPQLARQFNILFLVMGWFGKITHLSLISVFHIFRIGLGVAFLLVAWQFSKLFLSSRGRLLFVLLLGLSSGLGWLFPDAGAPSGPVDNWQPEAITFLSIYLNPLFLAALILMVGGFYYLILAHTTGRAKYSILAGVLFLLLGNVHTYDVITVACVWFVYLIAVGISEKKFPTRTVALSLLAAVIALPSVAYQFYLYVSDPVLHARASSPIPSPPIWSFLVGYGLLVLGAVVGAAIWLREWRKEANADGLMQRWQILLFSYVWVVVGFVVPYVPLAQQRKLIMGVHIPLVIFCAYALSWLIGRMQPVHSRVLAMALVIVFSISNITFMSKDMQLLNEGRTVTHYPAYISGSDLETLQYLRGNVDRDQTVFAPPTMSLLIPAYSGVEVYYGHWSETPGYADKLQKWFDFADSYAYPEKQIDILKDTGATLYVVSSEIDDSHISSLKSVQLRNTGPGVYGIITGRRE